MNNYLVQQKTRENNKAMDIVKLDVQIHITVRQNQKDISRRKIIPIHENNIVNTTTTEAKDLYLLCLLTKLTKKIDMYLNRDFSIHRRPNKIVLN